MEISAYLAKCGHGQKQVSLLLTFSKNRVVWNVSDQLLVSDKLPYNI